MTIVLNGTSGITNVNGSAAAPAETGTDTDTGIFFPAANTLGFSTNGAEVARFDSSGNLGLGVTPSAWNTDYKASQIGVNSAFYGRVTTTAESGVSANCFRNTSGNWTYLSNAAASRYEQSSGFHIWFNAASGTAGTTAAFTQAMTLDTNGKLLIGATSSLSSGGSLQVQTPASQTNAIDFLGANSTSGNAGAIGMFANGTYISSNWYYSGGQAKRVSGNGSAAISLSSAATNADSFINFSVGLTSDSSPTERARIDSSGNFMVGTTSSTDSSGIGFKVRPLSGVGGQVSCVADTSGGISTYHLYNINATNNGYRFYVNINGGISNYSGNNINLSDERTKTNIELAGSYLSKVCAIPVKLFNYKDEAEGEQRTLGVIAQDVEAVAPELVNQDGWLGEAPEGEAPLKSIYTTDLMFALMKSIQEQQALITQLQADVAALKAKA